MGPALEGGLEGGEADGAGPHRFGERGYEAASAGIDAEVRSKDGKLRSYGFVAQSFAERPIEPAPVDPEDAIESAPTAAPPLGLDSSSGLAGYASMEYQGLYVRPAWFWLASTLTGVAAAVAVIAIVNWQTVQEPLPPTPVATVTPMIDLNAEAAMLTSPLQQELDALQSDLKKAEEKVKRDIGL